MSLSDVVPYWQRGMESGQPDTPQGDWAGGSQMSRCQVCPRLAQRRLLSWLSELAGKL